MKKLIIIGASGHGKVISDIARLNGYEEIEFFDDDINLHDCNGWSVKGTVNQASETQGDLFVAIGNAELRERIMNRFAGRHFPVLIHPSAVVAHGVNIGEGSAVMAGAVINSGARVGKGCIINTSSSVDHDCVVGDYTHISVGAHLGGTVTVGSRTWIAIGVSVINNIDICDGCMVGAGSVVVKSIEKPGTYVGVPAKLI